MRLERWLPIYREIIADLGYDEEEDRRAGALLGRMLKGRPAPDIDSFHSLLGGRVTVVAKGPALRQELAQRKRDWPLIAAGSATAHMMNEGITPDLIVSDLDGEVGAEVLASSKGVPCFIHAHGDNMPALQRWVGSYRGVIIPTMQARPLEGVYNFGGFTDGDRAVEIARHFGAREIELIGFDFDWKEDNSPDRAKKIEWARRIVCEMNPRDVIIRGKCCRLS
jgi:uncharacterized Rossmann fold enzyme